MGLDFQYGDGQTPLDDDEREGLLIRTIATKSELDEFEQHNIERAILWTLNRRFKPELVFSETFIHRLHVRMYGEVWAWAGELRKTNKNLGVDKWQIPMELRSLLDDAKFWLEQSTYPPEELAVRFKHRLVAIHCFANGNGRHSRLTADIIISKIFMQPVFTWGAKSFEKGADARAAYLSAIRLADRGDVQPLVNFALS